MESLDGKFKLKGIFQVLPAQAGIERMLHGARSLARQAVATPDAPTPAGQRSAQLIALIITPAPAAAMPQRHADQRVYRRQIVALFKAQQQQARQGGAQFRTMVKLQLPHQVAQRRTIVIDRHHSMPGRRLLQAAAAGMPGHCRRQAALRAERGAGEQGAAAARADPPAGDRQRHLA